jgi:hypothetical protein
MKTLLLIADLVAIAALGYSWYQAELIPAWIALIWCVGTTVHDFEAWLESRKHD